MGYQDAELRFARNQVIAAGAVFTAASTNDVDLLVPMDIPAGYTLSVVFLCGGADIEVNAGAPTNGKWIVIGATDPAFAQNVRILGEMPGMGDLLHFGGALPNVGDAFEVPLASMQSTFSPRGTGSELYPRYLRCFYRNPDRVTDNYTEQTWSIDLLLRKESHGRIYPASTSS